MRTALDHAGAPGIPIFNKGGPFSFPARYLADATMPLNEKDAVARAMGHAPQVNLTLTDEDMEVIKDKEKMVQQAQFDAWVTARFKPHIDPAASEWLQKIYPEWFEMRAKENAEHHMIKEKYENILLRGPKSKEDLFLLYQVSQDPDLYNRLLGNTGPNWTVANHTTEALLSAVNKPREFSRGMFNPREVRRVIDAAQLGATAGTWDVERRQAGAVLVANVADPGRGVLDRLVHTGVVNAGGIAEDAAAVGHYPGARQGVVGPVWWRAATDAAFADRGTAGPYATRENYGGMGLPQRENPAGYAAGVAARAARHP